MRTPLKTSGVKLPFFSVRFGCLAILLAFYGWALIDTYATQISVGNPGMKPWFMTRWAWAYCLVGGTWIAMLLEKTKGEPSEFFLIFYSSVVLLSYLTLNSVYGEVDDGMLLVFLIILVVPVWALNLCQKIVPHFKFSGIVTSKTAQSFVAGLLLVTVSAAYLNATPSAGFGLDDSYVRRLEGRQIYAAGDLIAYALAMSMNGFAPYLAFRAGAQNNKFLLIIASGAAVFFFWLLGAKATFYYVAIAFALGLLVRRDKLKYFPLLLLGSVVTLYVGVLFEWAMRDGYSAIVDYFFRRVFAVQAEVLGFYFNFLANEKPFDWNLLTGAADPSFQVTYFVGDTYVHNVDANVNTNAFLQALSSNGIVGYVMAVVFVSVFLVVLDRLFRSSKNPIFIFLGFMYGLLAIEQAFTVAMVSSGIALLFMLTLLERYQPPAHPMSQCRVSG